MFWKGCYDELIFLKTLSNFRLLSSRIKFKSLRIQKFLSSKILNSIFKTGKLFGVWFNFPPSLERTSMLRQNILKKLLRCLTFNLSTSLLA